jgi:hypothetical protein
MTRRHSRTHNQEPGVHGVKSSSGVRVAWVAGEHHYIVSLSKNGRRGNGEGNRGNLRASTLGTLAVPSDP